MLTVDAERKASQPARPMYRDRNWNRGWGRDRLQHRHQHQWQCMLQDGTGPAPVPAQLELLWHRSRALGPAGTTPRVPGCIFYSTKPRLWIFCKSRKGWCHFYACVSALIESLCDVDLSLSAGACAVFRATCARQAQGRGWLLAWGGTERTKLKKQSQKNKALLCPTGYGYDGAKTGCLATMVTPDSASNSSPAAGTASARIAKDSFIIFMRSTVSSL